MVSKVDKKQIWGSKSQRKFVRV